jgi:hypothetical protein
MSESLGARLRQRREQQRIALTTIAEQTKIKLSLLEGLERDDVSRWPAGIFRRAFIRAYAHAIGAEPDVVVREFLELYPDPIDIGGLEAALASDGARGSAAPPTRFRYLVGSAFGSLSRGQTTAVQRGASEAADRSEPSDRKSSTSSSAPVVPAVPPFEADFSAAADLCTELCRVNTTSELVSLLPEAARILDAVGIIVWVWDSTAAGLRPSLTHGYSPKMVAQLPTVTRDAENATAAAFRSAQTCVVDGSDRASGALVVPLMTPGGCTGVLAIEVQHGREQTGSVRALVTIFAAQLARWIGAERPAEISDRRLA